MNERPAVRTPAPGIHQVTAPLPFGGLDHVHVYLAEGPDGGLVLIDAMHPSEESFALLEGALARMGRRVTDIERVYITHAHNDHYGLAGAVQEASGAHVICHPIAHREIEAAQESGRWEQAMDQYAEHGWEPPADRRRGGPPRRRPQMPLPTGVGHIEAGDRVRFAGSDWDVHWTPGHEWGHVVFFRESDRLLVGGDMLLWRITPHVAYAGEPEDPLGMFLDSLDRVADLDPALVLPGHERVFEEGRERARGIRAHHAERLRRCIEILTRGPRPGIEVTRELFDRELMVFEERMALSEALAHLEYLRLRGRLDREKVDGLWRYGLRRPLVG